MRAATRVPPTVALTLANCVPDGTWNMSVYGAPATVSDVPSSVCSAGLRRGRNSAATDYRKFTHGAQVEYPGQVPKSAEFAAAFRGHKPEAKLVGRTIDKSWLREALQPALEFRAKTGRPVHCGEFGVLDTASAESKARWYADMCDLLGAFRIPRSMWTYKETGFGLVDGRTGAVVNEAVVRAATKRW